MAIPLRSFLVSAVLGRKLEWSGASTDKDGALKSVLPRALQSTQTSVQLHTTSSSLPTVSVGPEVAMYAYCHSP